MTTNSENQTEQLKKGQQKRRPTMSGVIKNLQGETCFTLALWMTQNKKEETAEAEKVE